MANVIVSFRLPPDLIERIDVVAEKLGKKARGIHVSRTEALKVCLDRGIAVIEEELISKPPPARPKR